MGKTLYHSELSKMGPVTVTVKSDVLPSKFKGKPPFVSLEIDGEERNYSTENEACETFFDGQKGRRFTIVAEGREETATIGYVGEPMPDAAPPARAPKAALAPSASRRAPAKPPQQARSAPTLPPEPSDEAGAPEHGAGTPGGSEANHGAQPAKPPPRPPETAEDRLKRAKVHANRLGNTYLLAYQTGHFIRQAIRDQRQEEIEQGHFQGMVGSIFIQLVRDGFTNQMPTGTLSITPPPPAGSDNDGAAS